MPGKNANADVQRAKQRRCSAGRSDRRATSAPTNLPAAHGKGRVRRTSSRCDRSGRETMRYPTGFSGRTPTSARTRMRTNASRSGRNSCGEFREIGGVGVACAQSFDALDRRVTRSRPVRTAGAAVDARSVPAGADNPRCAWGSRQQRPTWEVVTETVAGTSAVRGSRRVRTTRPRPRNRRVRRVTVLPAIAIAPGAAAAVPIFENSGNVYSSIISLLQNITACVTCSLLTISFN